MTLHEAIVKLLTEKGRPMTTSEIADALNKNKWYTKRDGSPINPFQIHGRTRNYHQLFDREGSTVILRKEGKRYYPGSVDTTGRKIAGKNLASMSSVNADLKKKMLLNEKNFKPAAEIDFLLPGNPGLYCIRIRDISALPPPFPEELQMRGHNILYIGIASQSLYRRLNQELRARGHGTFFRSIGALLGYFPPKGSLVEKKNKKNYKFNSSDEARIIDWINKNLLVNWVEEDASLDTLESALVANYKPVINIAKNPQPVPRLAELRAACVRIANNYT